MRLSAPIGLIGISLIVLAASVLLLQTAGNVKAQADGKTLYEERCAFCHGDSGDGNGAVAPYLDPRPRDFTTGQFKLRTTASGELPLREDVIRTVKQGVQGTAMPNWDGVLTDSQIEAVVDYVMESFVPGWGSYEPTVIPVGNAPRRASAEMIEEGGQIYQELQCWKCHGQAGRADGPSAPTLQDEAGHPIRAADLTKAWRYKGGSEMADIFTRFATGMNGSPMPSFYDVFEPEEREDKLWALSAYVHSLQVNEPGIATVVTAKRVSGPLPSSADDAMWEAAEPVSFFLTGQVIAGPRWQTPGVDAVTVRALHDDEQLALLIEWDDPFQDTEAEGGEGTIPEDTYVNLDQFLGTAGPFPDALAVQFPREATGSGQRPYFFWGQPGRPVYLWKWEANGSAAEYNAAGFRQGLVEQENSQLDARATWADGRYQLLFTRPLSTGDPGDLELTTGEFIPIAFQAWEGSNGEAGMRLSLSSWYNLILEKPTPISVYIYSAVVILAVAGGEWLLVRQARRNRPE